MFFRKLLPRAVLPLSPVYTRKKIPSPRRLPLVGTTLSLLAAGSAPKLHLYIDTRHRELGPIFCDQIGPIRAIFVSDPRIARTIFASEGKFPAHVLPEPWIVYNKIHGCSRGLFFMDGEEWLRNRRKMNKLLLKGDTKWLEGACRVANENLLKKISAKCEFVENLETILYQWSLDVITAILVGAKQFGEVRETHGVELDNLGTIIHRIFATTTDLQLLPATLSYRLGLSRWKRFEDSVTQALTSTEDLVRQILNGNPSEDGLLSKMTKEEIDERLIVRIVTDLILAAGDTTAYTMEWILYLISKHPNVQEELYQNNIENSQLSKNIMKEALRLYPVAPFLTRFIPEDLEIEGYHLPKDTLVVFSLYSTGRDERYFENPNDFLPNRWSRDKNGDLKEMLQATIPFAMGARSCIGRKIAEIQLKMALSELVRRFKIVLKNDTDIEMVLKMVAVPSKPVKLRFIPR